MYMYMYMCPVFIETKQVLCCDPLDSLILLVTMASTNTWSIVPRDDNPPVVFPSTQSLFLYKAVLKIDKPVFQAAGYYPVKQSGPDAGHIGLRETPADALDRAGLFHEIVCKESHCLLRVEFTPQGIAHFVSRCQGSDHNHQSTLFKKTYKGSTDWGVWHFLDNLPFTAVDEDGLLLIQTQWFEIE